MAVLVCSPAAGRSPLCLNCHPTHHAGKGSCRTCHGGNPDAGRKEIAHHRLVAGRYARHTLGDVAEVRAGVKSIGHFACRRCHVVGGRGNRLSISLDLSARHLEPERLAHAIRQPASAMPDFRMTDDQVTSVVNALLAEFGVSAKQAARAERPRVVHFDVAGGAGGDPFSRQCGGCHRALSERLGALGNGAVGPNLSGLFSAYYPLAYAGDTPWTPQRLEGWLANPRKMRPAATMRPMKVTPEEVREIGRILSTDR